MKLWEIAGLEPEDGEEAMPFLEEHAQYWLRVPKVSLTEWAALDVLERAALVRAAKKDRLEAMVATDPLGAAAEYAEFDGGRAHRLLTLRAAVHAAAQARMSHAKAK